MTSKATEICIYTGSFRITGLTAFIIFSMFVIGAIGLTRVWFGGAVVVDIVLGVMWLSALSTYVNKAEKNVMKVNTKLPPEKVLEAIRREEESTL